MSNFDVMLETQGFGIEVPRCNLILRDRFIVPPFSVLNTMSGEWMERKRAWVGLGIQSEVGRGDNLTIRDPNLENLDVFRDKKKKADKEYAVCNPNEMRLADGTVIKRGQSGTSIFDPVLCEILYRWFVPGGGTILDPFCGGSVRGIVASFLGHEYTGIDLREEQVAANKAQIAEVEGASVLEHKPRWICGDSTNVRNLIAPWEDGYDFVFSCPPYGDLEVYSDDPADLSTMDYEEFIGAYRKIIYRACSLLKKNRFACFVVGEFRDKKGFYRNFVGETIQAFLDAGLEYYNEAILLTAIGSLPIRAGKQFSAGRKLGKAHQNILVFYKGNDHKDIKDAFPEM
jgi:DNA modification methylase